MKDDPGAPGRTERVEAIPRKSIYRLSIYHRCLQRQRDNGVETVSSEALARAAGVKPPQLRKDLAYFGQFGTRGLGYSVSHLARVLNDVLDYSKIEAERLTLDGIRAHEWYAAPLSPTYQVGARCVVCGVLCAVCVCVCVVCGGHGACVGVCVLRVECVRGVLF